MENIKSTIMTFIVFHIQNKSFENTNFRFQNYARVEAN